MAVYIVYSFYVTLIPSKPEGEAKIYNKTATIPKNTPTTRSKINKFYNLKKPELTLMAWPILLPTEKCPLVQYF